MTGGNLRQPWRPPLPRADRHIELELQLVALSLTRSEPGAGGGAAGGVAYGDRDSAVHAHRTCTPRPHIEHASEMECHVAPGRASKAEELYSPCLFSCGRVAGWGSGPVRCVKGRRTYCRLVGHPIGPLAWVSGGCRSRRDQRAENKHYFLSTIEAAFDVYQPCTSTNPDLAPDSKENAGGCGGVGNGDERRATGAQAA